MILTCPSCDSKFKVKDDAIGPNGRKVKCRNCANTWHAMPEGAAAPAPAPRPAPADDPAPPPPPPPAQDMDPEPDLPPPPRPAAAPDPMMDEDPGAPPRAADPPPIPQGGDFVLRQRKPKVEKKSPLMAWVILIFFVVAIAAVGWFFQRDIVAAFPAMQKVYGWVGIQPSVVGYGLVLPEPSGAMPEQTQDGLKLTITGEIMSELSERTVVPMLRGALVDTNGMELHVWTFEADSPDILPGETVSYTTEVTTQLQGITSVQITFTDESDMMMEEGMSGQSQ